MLVWSFLQETRSNVKTTIRQALLYRMFTFGVKVTRWLLAFGGNRFRGEVGLRMGGSVFLMVGVLQRDNIGGFLHKG